MAGQFETILEALRGETVLVQPRVSREVTRARPPPRVSSSSLPPPQTIVYVLKEHTEMLRGVRQVRHGPLAASHSAHEGHGCDERNGSGAQEPGG